MRECENCKGTFSPSREDNVFCCEACKAEYARNGGYARQHFHADNFDYTFGRCEWCGSHFSANGYANRGGERRKRFCSDTCRQKAYRASKMPGNGPKARNTGKQQHQQKQQQQQQKQQKQTNGTDSVDWSRWRSKNAARILGVSPMASRQEARNAWMALCKIYHPDICKEPYALEIMQCINWAWDRMKK